MVTELLLGLCGLTSGGTALYPIVASNPAILFQYKEQSMFSISKILLPVDFSDRCVRAIRRGLPVLANRFKPEITVLHVLPTYSLFGPGEMGMTLPADLVVKVKVQ